VKLHDLSPAPGAHTKRTRVGRGIAAGKGKTAGRGTKGQKSRAGSGIPAWFEGGQTPIHVRVPKLRGFKRPLWRVEYQVVNIGRISEYAAAGRFGEVAAKAPYTINPDTLRAAGLISNDRRPVKVLGSGDVDAKLFVMADAFTASARSKIEAAGGTVQEIAALASGSTEAKDAAPAEGASAPARTPKSARASKGVAPAAAPDAPAEAEDPAAEPVPAEPAPAKSSRRATKAVAATEPTEAAAAADAGGLVVQDATEPDDADVTETTPDADAASTAD
jgi:large subunit ribosomal protein L15